MFTKVMDSEDVVRDAVAVSMLSALIATITAVLGWAMFLDAQLAISVLRIWAACLSALASIAILTSLLNSWLTSLLMVFGFLYATIMLRVPEAGFLLYLGLPAMFLIRRHDLRLPPFAFPAALIAAIAILGVERAQTTFNMLQRLHAGEVHTDTLYHSAMAAMMKTYGVVSIGVDGLVPTEYHTFSHGLVAAISTISGVSVIEAYGIAPAILFAPLMIAAAVFAARDLTLPSSSDRAPEIAFATVLVSLLLVALPAWYWKRALWDSFLVSESYMLALVLMLAALPSIWRADIDWREWLVVGAAICVASLSKPSVGAMMIGLMLVRILFITRGARSLFELSGFLLIVALLFVLLRSNAEANQHYIAFNAFDFPLTYGRTTSAYRAFTESAGLESAYAAVRMTLAFAGFYFAHFVVSWVAIVILLQRMRISDALLHMPTLCVVATTVVGVLMVSTLDIAAGSLYYFTNVAMFIALPVVVSGAWHVQVRFSMPQPLFASAACFLIVGSITAGPIMTKSRITLDNGSENSLVTALINLRTGKVTSAFVAHDAPDLRSSLPLDEPRKTGLLFPALSERAWYGVIDPSLDCDYAFHGYQSHIDADDTSGDACFLLSKPSKDVILFKFAR